MFGYLFQLDTEVPKRPANNIAVQEPVGEKTFRTKNQQVTAHVISLSD
jgi:hypothetical protein